MNEAELDAIRKRRHGPGITLDYMSAEQLKQAWDAEEDRKAMLAYVDQLRAVIAAADRFIYLRKTSHDGHEIHAALEGFYAARKALGQVL